jgi:hypothetical protein
LKDGPVFEVSLKITIQASPKYENFLLKLMKILTSFGELNNKNFRMEMLF